jgi:hypothetical protein
MSTRENSSLQAIRRALFREPRRRARDWFVVLGGCVAIIGGLFGPFFGERDLFSLVGSIGLGLWLLLLGAAELLPRNLTTLAGLLRVGSIVIILLTPLLGLMLLILRS